MKRKCLVAPEANLRESVLLFGLSLQYRGDIEFIWRLPAMLTLNDLISFDKKFRTLPKWVTVSNTDLTNDIHSCDYVLYRGSSVCKLRLYGLNASILSA